MTSFWKTASRHLVRLLALLLGYRPHSAGGGVFDLFHKVRGNGQDVCSVSYWFNLEGPASAISRLWRWR